MSRLVEQATASGVASDTLGTGSTTFCGSGTQLYDVPGALTPIYVCCNWDTPIAGYVNIDINFSLYDCIVVRGTATTRCCFIDGLMVVPSNQCIDSFQCCTCYCALNQFYAHRYSGSNCNFSNAEGCLCTGPIHCWNRISYFEFGFESGVGTYGCECQCKYQHLSANIFVNSYSCNARKDVQVSLGSHCQFNGCWQSKKVDSVAKLDPLSFCKIVIRGSQYNCFTPLLCGTCKVDGAFFGVWGKLRSNPYVSAKNSVYKCS